MKLDRDNKPPFIIGARVALGQAIMGLMNGGVFIWNFANPENTIPGEVVGMMGQPVIFFAQVWYVNRFGVTQ
jgi:hypothetical protein